MFADELLLTYDVSDSVAVVVGADRATTWKAPVDVDLVAVGHERLLAGILEQARDAAERARARALSDRVVLR